MSDLPLDMIWVLGLNPLSSHPVNTMIDVVYSSLEHWIRVVRIKVHDFGYPCCVNQTTHNIPAAFLRQPPAAESQNPISCLSDTSDHWLTASKREILACWVYTRSKTSVIFHNVTEEVRHLRLSQEWTRKKVC